MSFIALNLINSLAVGEVVVNSDSISCLIPYQQLLHKPPVGQGSRTCVMLVSGTTLYVSEDLRQILSQIPAD